MSGRKPVRIWKRHCRSRQSLREPGASLGGRLASQIAISFPEQVARLVLVAPAGITLAKFPQPDFPHFTHRDWPNYFMHNSHVIRP